MSKILTVAIPTFNMEKWLEKNLATYYHPDLIGKLQVLCLNNASEDSSKSIIESFVEKCPEIFTLVDRDSRGYGSSINKAMELAEGKYFRIVDADDWVDTDALIDQITELEKLDVDVAVTDYEIVNMQTGEMTPVTSRQKGIAYNTVFEGCDECAVLLPSIHSTTYKTELLRKSGFYMQDKMFFVDEEYVILPYLYAETAICLPFDVYRYQVANPQQSTSPKNRAKFLEHREKILIRLMDEYEKAAKSGAEPKALAYCLERIRRGIGDHYTTLYMYVEDRKQGRELADKWTAEVNGRGIEFMTEQIEKKRKLLALMNRIGLSLESYGRLKKLFGIGK